MSPFPPYFLTGVKVIVIVAELEGWRFDEAVSRKDPAESEFLSPPESAEISPPSEVPLSKTSAKSEAKHRTRSVFNGLSNHQYQDASTHKSPRLLQQPSKRVCQVL